MKRLLATTALVGALALGGCWSAETEVDVVADVELREQVVADGMYCLVDETEEPIVKRDACIRTTWNADAQRHALENHGLFGTEIPWAQLASLDGPYHVVQLRDPDEDEGADEVHDGELIVATLQIQHNAIFVLPRPSVDAFNAIAATYANIEVEAGDYGGFSIDGGDPLQLRAFMSEIAAKWAEENDAQANPLYFPGDDDDERPLLLMRVDEAHTWEQENDEFVYAKLGFEMDVYGGRDY